MAVALVEQFTVSEGDVRRHTIRYSGVLDAREKLSTIAEPIHAGSDLLFSGREINATPHVVAGKPTKGRESVSFTVSGQVAANSPYRFTVRVTTTRGQTINCDVIMHVV